MTKERYLLIMKFILMALRHATTMQECINMTCNLGHNFNIKCDEVTTLFNTSPADCFDTCKVFGFYYVDAEKKEIKCNNR